MEDKHKTMALIVPMKCLIKKHGLINTKHTSELPYQLAIFLEKNQKTMVPVTNSNST